MINMPKNYDNIFNDSKNYTKIFKDMEDGKAKLYKLKFGNKKDKKKFTNQGIRYFYESIKNSEIKDATYFLILKNYLDMIYENKSELKEDLTAESSFMMGKIYSSIEEYSFAEDYFLLAKTKYSDSGDEEKLEEINREIQLAGIEFLIGNSKPKTINV